MDVAKAITIRQLEIESTGIKESKQLVQNMKLIDAKFRDACPCCEEDLGVANS